MFDRWTEGVELLIGDDLVSYHSFFGFIFAEIAFLWCFGIENAMIYTLLLMGAVCNVLLIAALKGSYIANSNIGSMILSLVYLLSFISFMVVASMQNILIGLLIFLLPLVWAWFAMTARMYQISVLCGNFPKWIVALSNFIHKPVVTMTIQLIILFIPLLAFTAFVIFIDVAWWLKIILPLVVFLLSPLWAYIEDEWATQNIFELAYEMY